MDKKIYGKIGNLLRMIGKIDYAIDKRYEFYMEVENQGHITLPVQESKLALIAYRDKLKSELKALGYEEDEK